MIIHVAKFLFEFSRNAHISPDFLRLGIDLDSVGMFAAALSEEIQSGETGGNKKTGGFYCILCIYYLGFIVFCVHIS